MTGTSSKLHHLGVDIDATGSVLCYGGGGRREEGDRGENRNSRSSRSSSSSSSSSSIDVLSQILKCSILFFYIFTCLSANPPNKYIAYEPQRTSNSHLTQFSAHKSIDLHLRAPRNSLLYSTNIHQDRATVCLRSGKQMKMTESRVLQGIITYALCGRLPHFFLSLETHSCFFFLSPPLPLFTQAFTSLLLISAFLLFSPTAIYYSRL